VFRECFHRIAERDAQRPPLTVTTAQATDCEITPRRENGKRSGGSLEQKLCGVACIVITYGREFSAHLSRDGDDERNNLERHEVVNVSGQEAARERDAEQPIARRTVHNRTETGASSPDVGSKAEKPIQHEKRQETSAREG